MKKNISMIIAATIICMMASIISPASVTVFAAEKAASFTVKYDSNSAKGAAPSDNGNYFAGEFATVAGAGELSMNNSVFAGWSETSGAALADYVPGDKIKVQHDTTLYGVWVTEKAPTQTMIISNSGKIRNTQAGALNNSYFPDRTFVAGN